MYSGVISKKSGIRVSFLLAALMATLPGNIGWCQTPSTAGSFVGIVGVGGENIIVKAVVDGQTVAVRVPIYQNQFNLQQAASSITPPQFGGPPSVGINGYVSITMPDGEKVLGAPMTYIDGMNLGQVLNAYETAAVTGTPVPSNVPQLTPQMIDKYNTIVQQNASKGLSFTDDRAQNIMLSSDGNLYIVDNTAIVTGQTDVQLTTGARDLNKALALQNDLSAQGLISDVGPAGNKVLSPEEYAKLLTDPTVAGNKVLSPEEYAKLLTDPTFAGNKVLSPEEYAKLLAGDMAPAEALLGESSIVNISAADVAGLAGDALGLGFAILTLPMPNKIVVPLDSQGQEILPGVAPNRYATFDGLQATVDQNGNPLYIAPGTYAYQPINSNQTIYLNPNDPTAGSYLPPMANSSQYTGIQFAHLTYGPPLPAGYQFPTQVYGPPTPGGSQVYNPPASSNGSNSSGPSASAPGTLVAANDGSASGGTPSSLTAPTSPSYNPGPVSGNSPSLPQNTNAANAVPIQMANPPSMNPGVQAILNAASSNVNAPVQPSATSNGGSIAPVPYIQMPIPSQLNPIVASSAPASPSLPQNTNAANAVPIQMANPPSMTPAVQAILNAASSSNPSSAPAIDPSAPPAIDTSGSTVILGNNPVIDTSGSQTPVDTSGDTSAIDLGYGGTSDFAQTLMETYLMRDTASNGDGEGDITGCLSTYCVMWGFGFGGI